MEIREGRSIKTRLDHLCTMYRIRRGGRMLKNQKVKRFLKLKVELDLSSFIGNSLVLFINL